MGVLSLAAMLASTRRSHQQNFRAEKMASKFDAVVSPSRVGGSVPTRRMIIMLQTMQWIMWKHRCHVVHLAAGDPVLSLSPTSLSLKSIALQKLMFIFVATLSSGDV